MSAYDVSSLNEYENSLRTPDLCNSESELVLIEEWLDTLEDLFATELEEIRAADAQTEAHLARLKDVGPLVSERDEGSRSCWARLFCCCLGRGNSSEDLQLLGQGGAAGEYGTTFK